MSIFGVGTDLVNIKRIKKVLIKNKKIKKRIFSEEEILFCQNKLNKYNCFAKRFAAKEAFAKAIGTGLSKGISFKDIQVIKDNLGKPGIKIVGKSLNIVCNIIKSKKFKVFLSLSDDIDYVVAMITIEKWVKNILI